MQKSWTKTIGASLKRLFSTRNIIIVSDHKVGHYPMSGKSQLVMAMCVIGFFSWVSYMTGSYMAAQSVLVEKDKKILIGNMEKRQMDQEFALLKRDIMKLRDNGKELSEYSQFILNQYDSQKSLTPFTRFSLDGDLNDFTDHYSALGDNGSKLFERISYLENRIEKIKSENDHLVDAIRDRTDGKIDFLEDLIQSTGLNLSVLEKRATTRVKAEEKSKSVFGGLGGPFVPLDSGVFDEDDKELLGDIDRLILLFNIADALPLDTPLSDFKMMSGFGHRADPFNHRMAMHEGVDLAGPIGSKVRTTNDGKVVLVDYKGAYGLTVDVDHGLGIKTRYAHLSRALVKEGDSVKKGQIIAVQGSTGRSTGAHLHYEVRYNDHPINPQKFLNAGHHVLD